MDTRHERRSERITVHWRGRAQRQRDTLDTTPPPPHPPPHRGTLCLTVLRFPPKEPYLSPTSRLLHPVSHIPSPTSRLPHPVSHIPSPTSCLLHPVSYILSPTSCLLLDTGGGPRCLSSWRRRFPRGVKLLERFRGTKTSWR